MPSSHEHQIKYQENRNFLDLGGAGGGPLAASNGPWAAIVAFYAALHLMERLASIINLHHMPPGAHGQRARWLRGHAQHRAILSPYNDLRTASEISRYGTANQFTRAYPGTVVQDVLVDQKLVAIETYLNSILNPPAPGDGGLGGSLPTSGS